MTQTVLEGIGLRVGGRDDILTYGERGTRQKKKTVENLCSKKNQDLGSSCTAETGDGFQR